jgi:hypothetical protein
LRHRCLTKILLVTTISFLLTTQVSAWPPGAHDAIGDKASESLPQIQITKDNPADKKFRCGNILADIAHVLELPPFFVQDAHEVMEISSHFAEKMFELAKQKDNKDQMAWSAGWYSHNSADRTWGDYCTDPNVDIPYGTLKEYFFELTNEAAIKFKKQHELIAETKPKDWIWYPDLIADAYYQITHNKLPLWKINLATKIWVVALVQWYESLPRSLEYLLQNSKGLWHITRENWEKYFDKSVNRAIDYVNNLYQNPPTYLNNNTYEKPRTTPGISKFLLKYRLITAIRLLNSGVIDVPLTRDKDATYAGFVVKDMESWNKAVDDLSKTLLKAYWLGIFRYHLP